MESHARSSTSIAGAMVGLVAALFTRISILPHSPLTLPSSLFFSSNLPTCAATASDFLPAPFISLATSSRSGNFRLAKATSAPSLGSPTGIASPMPRLPPVTNATLPFREKSSGEKFIAYLPKKIYQLWMETNTKVYTARNTTRNLNIAELRLQLSLLFSKNGGAQGSSYLRFL